MDSVENLAVFLPNPVGDVVMSTPVLRALRAHCPAARIVHVGRSPALSVLSGSEWADATIEDRTHKTPQLANGWSLVREIRRHRPDIAVLLPNSLRPAVLARLGGARRVAGYARNGRGVLLSDPLQVPRDRQGRRVPLPTIDYYRAILDRLGVPCLSRQMSLPVRDEDRRTADALLSDARLDETRPLVMLNPGAAFGVSKMWPAERYAALADALIARREAQVIVNAAPVEREVAAAVVSAMTHPPLLSFHERDNTIGLLKGLVRRCHLLVTNDTGARHFGAAMGIGVVTIFGSTDPVWAQIDYPREEIIRADVPCSPCQQKQCPTPPGETFHQCMTAISVDRVLPSAERMLEETLKDGPLRQENQ
ncbi:MAG: lipopolysaccharide heptosyltransferase II [Phycisphaerae bacterium]